MVITARPSQLTNQLWPFSPLLLCWHRERAKKLTFSYTKWTFKWCHDTHKLSFHALPSLVFIWLQHLFNFRTRRRRRQRIIPGKKASICLSRQHLVWSRKASIFFRILFFAKFLLSFIHSNVDIFFQSRLSCIVCFALGFHVVFVHNPRLRRQHRRRRKNVAVSYRRYAKDEKDEENRKILQIFEIFTEAVFSMVRDDRRCRHSFGFFSSTNFQTSVCSSACCWHILTVKINCCYTMFAICFIFFNNSEKFFKSEIRFVSKFDQWLFFCKLSKF